MYLIVIYLFLFVFFFSCLIIDFLVLILPSSFWNLVSNIFFFFFFLTCCLSFNIWRSSFLRSSWLGCYIFFFLSLELRFLLSVVSFFGWGCTVVVFWGGRGDWVKVFIDHLTFSLSLPSETTVALNGFPSFLAASNRLKYRDSLSGQPKFKINLCILFFSFVLAKDIASHCTPNRTYNVLYCIELITSIIIIQIQSDPVVSGTNGFMSFYIQSLADTRRETQIIKANVKQ